jgi:hypothetical protein
MSLQEIPLTSDPNQNFTVTLSIDGAPLTLSVNVRFNYMAGYWLLTIFNASNGLLIDSVPMITGTYPAGNLLGQQKYLNIGAWYVINVSNLQVDTSTEEGYGQGPYGAGGYGGELGQGGIDYPNNLNLGTDFQLWVDDTPTV